MLSAARAQARSWMEALPAARPPALRRAEDPDWLLATDLPRLVSAEHLARFREQAERAGWRTAPAPAGWLLLDAPLTPPPVEIPETPPPGETGALLSLLLRHPDGAEDPRDLRTLLKAAEQGSAALERVCAQLHREGAVRLREGRPLPGALIPWLCAAIRRYEQEEKR